MISPPPQPGIFALTLKTREIPPRALNPELQTLHRRRKKIWSMAQERNPAWKLIFIESICDDRCVLEQKHCHNPKASNSRA